MDTGTTFNILLPRVNETVSREASAESFESLQGVETVLVVEDEEAVRKLVRDALEVQGYVVLTASHGHDAIEQLHEYQGDVHALVTDVIMPGMSGRELAERVKSMHQGLQILYMSGYTADALDRVGLQGSSEHFIQKPFTPLGLVRKVRAILDQKV